MRQRVLKRPILGFAAGAVTGGALVSAFMTFVYATSYPVEGGTFVPDFQGTVMWAVLSLTVATIVWAIGLIIVGYPIWLLLHRFSTRGPLAAALSGVTAVYLVGLALGPLSVTSALDLDRILLAIAGGVVGFVIQRIAYKSRPKPPRPSPAPAS